MRIPRGKTAPFSRQAQRVMRHAWINVLSIWHEKKICFSRSIELHEKVPGAFIEKHMFC
ncbi:hypothetical protein EL006_06395 [Salmonella enterica subsp. enterica serovar Stanleyville]|nr:hypothetical protein EL006_06395 [Salmonella enterica subsp. enterica serovar Stanleyville]